MAGEAGEVHYHGLADSGLRLAARGAPLPAPSQEKSLRLSRCGLFPYNTVGDLPTLTEYLFNRIHEGSVI